VLEAIDIQKEHRQPSLVTLGQRERAGKPVSQQQAVWQVGEGVVAREVQHLHRRRARRADVPEHNLLARQQAQAVIRERHRVFDGRFRPVASDQDAVRGQCRGYVSRNCLIHGVRGLACGAVNDVDHFLEWPAGRLGAGPSRHLFRGPVEVRHTA